MYQVFNMGHLLEVYTDAQSAQGILDIAAEYGIAAKVIGRVEAHAAPAACTLELHGPEGVLYY
jgi:phosphoribosylformylglycinamidine cyclo-ligase